MRKGLMLLFFAVFIAMIAVTTIASLERGVMVAVGDLWHDAWFRATLADAYCGFIACGCWIAYREKSWFGRLGWWVAIALLGNIAMSLYAIFRLSELPPAAPVWQALLRSEDRKAPPSSRTS
ncbi:MAG: DUF1475 family protein [Thermoanaerobaculia bacterium]